MFPVVGPAVAMQRERATAFAASNFGLVHRQGVDRRHVDVAPGCVRRRSTAPCGARVRMAGCPYAWRPLHKLRAVEKPPIDRPGERITGWRCACVPGDGRGRDPSPLWKCTARRRRARFVQQPPWKAIANRSLPLSTDAEARREPIARRRGWFGALPPGVGGADVVPFCGRARLWSGCFYLARRTRAARPASWAWGILPGG